MMHEDSLSSEYKIFLILSNTLNIGKNWRKQISLLSTY